MKGMIIAAAALMAGPAAPPAPTPGKPPCVKDKGERKPLVPDKPSDAQRFNPGLF